MANSRKHRPSDLAGLVRAQLALHVPPGSRITLGLSGGVDSVVLLHLLALLAPTHPFQLEALHIHHGISPKANAWADFCRTLCARLAVPLGVRHVTLTHAAEQGLEAAARHARYAEFARLDTDFIALAHNRDDQAETVLLQLLRGAGAKGLAAMPACRTYADGKVYLRPLLDIARAGIEAWARQHGLQWVEDESNLDTAINRNFLRHEVLPLIASRYPAWRSTLARSAHNLAEAAELLDELAAFDATDSIVDHRLDCTRLATLSPPRARNLLRHFLARHRVTMPSQARLAEMLEQLTTAGRDRHVHIQHAGRALYRYQGWAHLLPHLPAPEPQRQWPWQGEARLALPELGGTLHFIPATGHGLDTARLSRAPVTIRLRQGGEHLRPDCRRPGRSLKNLLQESAIPPWQRERLPLLYCGDDLVWVAGIGVDCAWQAPAGAPGTLPAWCDNAR